MTRDRSRRLALALSECLEWVDENDGELNFFRDGRVELSDAEGIPVALLDSFTVEEGGEQLARLLEQADEQTEEPAAPEEPPRVVVPRFTYLGLGSTAFAWSERRKVIVRPEVEFRPVEFKLPVRGYLLHQATAAGQKVLSNENGLPIELFSDISTFPRIEWPVIGPWATLELDLSAPPMPAAPPAFSGAIYGVPKKR